MSGVKRGMITGYSSADISKMRKRNQMVMRNSVESAKDRKYTRLDMTGARPELQRVQHLQLKYVWVLFLMFL